MEIYFKSFHSNYEVENGAAPSVRLKKFYQERFGRQHFILPLILLAVTTSCLLIWSGYSVQTWLDTGNLNFSPHYLPLFCVLGIAGAYAYGLSDQIQRCQNWDLSPSDVYWVSFRLFIAVPLAWALSYFFRESVAFPAAF